MARRNLVSAAAPGPRSSQFSSTQAYVPQVRHFPLLLTSIVVMIVSLERPSIYRDFVSSVTLLLTSMHFRMLTVMLNHPCLAITTLILKTNKPTIGRSWPTITIQSDAVYGTSYLYGLRAADTVGHGDGSTFVLQATTGAPNLTATITSTVTMILTPLKLLIFQDFYQPTGVYQAAPIGGKILRWLAVLVERVNLSELKFPSTWK